MSNKKIIILISSFDNKFSNVYFDENNNVVTKLKIKINKLKHKTYEKIICDHNNNKIYINPLDGNINKVTQETQYNHTINSELKYIAYELNEKNIDIECVPILNTYHNQETYIVTEYFVDDQTTIIFFKNKDNNLIKIYGKTNDQTTKLINFMIN